MIVKGRPRFIPAILWNFSTTDKAWQERLIEVYVTLGN
jgi:hypothetical protein